MLKWLGLLLVLISWTAGFYLTKAWPGTKAMSISRHAASAKSATRLFAVTLLVGGTVSYFWLVAWFVPHINLQSQFIALLTVTFVAQIIVGLIPDSNRGKSKLHRIAAYSMTMLYVPLGLLVVSSHNIGKSAKIIGVTCLAYMVATALVFLAIKRARTHHLIVQALYIVAFQVLILSAAYLK